MTPSGAAVYQVTGLGDSQADNSPAVVDTNHAGTTADPYLAPSLRAAVLAANVAGGSSLIEFAPSLTATAPGTINLGIDGDDTFGPSALYITSTITIQGSASNHGITIARDAAAQPTRLRLFDVAQNASLTLNNLTLSGGLARGGNASVYGGGGAGLGGAIINQGRLDLFADTLTDNQALGGDGAWTYGGDTMPNTAGGGLGGDGSATGGGGPNGGSSAAPNGGFGGGGFNGGSGGFGGGASGNHAGGFGGGGYIGGGEGMGGALFNYGGTVFITNSTLYRNTALGGRDGLGISLPHVILGVPPEDDSRQASVGGAVFNLNGTVTVTNSTLAFNTVVLTGATVEVFNLTGPGGAIFNFGSGGELTQSGPSLPVRTAAITLNNSILSNSILANTSSFSAADFNQATAADAGAVAGTTSLAGSNDDIQTADYSLTGITNLRNLDPGFGAFGDYGGPTSVLPLADTSFGHDMGDNSLAVDPANGNAPLTTDQRGFPRILNAGPSGPLFIAKVDWGAFEYHVPPSVGPVSPLTGYAFTPLTNVTVATFTYDNNTAPAAAFEATIDWGDGTTSVGTVVQSATGYSVLGTHTYTQPSPRTDGWDAYPIFTRVHFNGTSAPAVTSANILVELLPDGTRGTAQQRFVAQVYRDLLNRGVDPGGLANWVGVLQQLQAAGMSLSTAEQTVVYDIETNASHEYYINLVHSFYEHYLGRQEGASDAVGFADDVALLSYGAATYPGQLVYAENQVRMNILLSPEYLAKQGGTNVGFLQAMYEDNLGRSATTDAGAASFLTQLTQGTLSRAQFVSAVLLGGEFESDQVDNWYRQFFVRPAGTADMPHVQSLVQQLQAGVPDVTLIAGLLGDPGQEFFKLVEL